MVNLRDVSVCPERTLALSLYNISAHNVYYVKLGQSHIHLVHNRPQTTINHTLAHPLHLFLAGRYDCRPLLNLQLLPAVLQARAMDDAPLRNKSQTESLLQISENVFLRGFSAEQDIVVIMLPESVSLGETGMTKRGKMKLNRAVFSAIFTLWFP